MNSTITNDPRWRRMRKRDTNADGTFFYSVKTSGVYCLPSCKSRPANPENVAFHHSSEEARQAGFRPCKRCKPDQFEQQIGKYAMRETIQYTTRESSLGLTLVALSDKGVCAILMDDSVHALTTDLKARFPEAIVKHNDAALRETADAVCSFIDQPKGRFTEKLDVRGTEFQRRVWEQLLRVPAGKTSSYAEVAMALGAPNAVRAVAGACAANALAVVIPCHRVVKSDGALSGYRWGVERKRRLLEAEGAR